MIAGSDLIRLNTATGHGFIRQSGVRARCVFSDLSQQKAGVQGDYYKQEYRVNITIRSTG